MEHPPHGLAHVLTSVRWLAADNEDNGDYGTRDKDVVLARSHGSGVENHPVLACGNAVSGGKPCVVAVITWLALIETAQRPRLIGARQINVQVLYQVNNHMTVRAISQPMRVTTGCAEVIMSQNAL